MYIAIAGNIGSGKTSLTEILSKRFGITAHYEDIENPYIGDFYKDMNRWSFNLQVYFLGSRIKQSREALALSGDLIQDRTIYEDAYIFADNLHRMGLMSSRDFDTYMKLFALSEGLIQQPDLLIYLKASVPTLKSQIQKRGRAYEMSIDEDYLQRLNAKYDNWIENIYKGEVMVVDIDKCDFILNPEIIERIERRIESIRNRKSCK